MTRSTFALPPPRAVRRAASPARPDAGLRAGLRKRLCAGLCAGLLGGCATASPTAPVYDPWEGFNRKVYRFNTVLDDNVLAPVARGYRRVVPDIVESGITNFFSNLDDVTVVANDLLQAKPLQAASDTGRFLVNSTVGLLGFIDVGSRIGLPKHPEDFGQTLGRWDVGEGPFIMLPLLGPANARSTAGIPVDSTLLTLPPYVVDETGVLIGLGAVDVVQTRARLLAAGNLLNTASLDPYLTLRDFWVQRHRRLTVDGEVPVAIGLPGDDGASDDLDDLDRMDELDELDGLDELDRLDRMGDGDELDRLDELDAPAGAPDGAPRDRLDELDRLDALDALGAATGGTSAPVQDELDALDALDDPDVEGPEVGSPDADDAPD